MSGEERYSELGEDKMVVAHRHNLERDHMDTTLHH